MITLNKQDQLSGGQSTREALLNVGTEAMVIQNYTRSLLAQPTEGIKFDAAPDLPKHLLIGQSHATNWDDHIHPLLLSTITGAVSFANTWESFSSDMRKYAKAGDWKTVSTGIEIMMRQLAVQSNNANAVIASLNPFNTNLAGDGRNFTSDYNALSAAVEGDKGALASLKKQLHSYQKAAQAGTGIIVGSALGEVVGVTAIFLGAMLLPVTVGMSSVVVVAGIGIVGGSTAGIIIGSKMLNSAAGNISKLQTQIAALNADVSAMSAFDTNLSQFSQGVQRALTAVQQMQTAWNYLHLDFENVKNDVDRLAVETPWFLDQMNTADADWKVVKDMSLGIQKQSLLEHKEVDMSKPDAQLVPVPEAA